MMKTVLLVSALFGLALASGMTNNDAGALDAAYQDFNNLLARYQGAQQSYNSLMQRQQTINADMDSYWLLINAILVFAMMTGFGAFEVGAVRSKNVQIVLFKNLMIASIGALCWWFLGYGLSFGDANGSNTRNAFIGNGHVFLASDGETLSNRDYGRWFFEYTYAILSATIMSGSLAERTQLRGYFLFAAMYTLFIYPVIAHWVWSTSGWLSPFAVSMQRLGPQGMFDYAGGSVVMITAGCAGLAGALVLGPRLGRFDNPDSFLSHNKAMMTVGSFLILFGWFGFTMGRTLGLSATAFLTGAPLASDFTGAAAVASKISINTVLGATGGGLTGLILSRIIFASTFQVTSLMYGAFAGLAAISAPVPVIEPWAALAIGAAGGLLFLIFDKTLTAFHIDDPLSAFSWAAIPGLWGLIATGLLATETGTLRAYGNFGAKDTFRYGLFYGGGGTQLWVQIVGGLAIFGFSLAVSFIFFFLLNRFGFLKVSEEVEKAGLDVSKHGGLGYSSSFHGDDSSAKHFSNEMARDSETRPLASS